jgi:hypothetical protein
MSTLREHKLAKSYFTLSKKRDKSGLRADVIWMTPAQIVSENCEAEPGISVLTLGFLPIGSCATGSGDPYFLDLRQDSNDPPVVRVPHDYALESPYPIDRVELVSSSLSEFFHNAHVRSTNDSSVQHLCPVCGCVLDFEPWCDSLPADEMCPCCLVQFGYDDADAGSRRDTYARWRQHWIGEGMPWRSKGQKPPQNWDARAQLARISAL